jgi:Uncharacterized conserved protein
MSANTPESPAPSRIWTVGHSTRPWEDFVGLLQLHGIEAIADVRRHPGSRRYPWFGSEAMAAGLADAGIAYLWLPELGGRRKVQPGSPNGGWRNASFQGYADHMATAEFSEALARALELARTKRTALIVRRAAVVAMPPPADRRPAVAAHGGAAHPGCQGPRSRMCCTRWRACRAATWSTRPAQGGLFADDASS